VPSFDHEILVDLFRENAVLASELLRSCVGIDIDHARADHGSIDLSQVVSPEYRADNVAILRGADGRPVTGVIVEVQLRKDRDKLQSWPVYVAALRARLGCPAMLLVIAPKPAIARWARRPIELGHPGFSLTPLVISFANVPRVRDPTAASQLPELAMLSVMAHPEVEIAQAAIQAISGLPADRARLYLDVNMKALPVNARQIVEEQMIKGYQYQSDFARKYYGQGHEEGREEGRQEGLRGAVLTLARTKLGKLSDDDVAAIEAVSDLHVLNELIASLGQTSSTRKARAALARALAPGR
jgi:hypothetical protein